MSNGGRENGIRIARTGVKTGLNILEGNYEKLDFTNKYPALIVIHKEQPPQHSPLHWHEGAELIYSTNWNLVILIEGESYTIHPGEFIIINPYELHEISPEKKTGEMAVMSITFDVNRLMSIRPDAHIFRFLRGTPDAEREICRRMEECCDKLYALVDEKSKKEFMINAVIYEIVQIMLDDFVIKEEEAHPVRKRESRAKAMLAYVMEHYREELSTKSVAAHFGYSREYFCKVFKKCTNMTFKEYLTKVRLKAAVEQMKDAEVNYMQIALSCGFSDVKSFNNAFKKAFGMNPGQYQKQFEGKGEKNV